MAIIDRKGRYLGTVGPYSFRVLDGVNVVQSKPGKGRVKQTDATKASGTEFGLASITAKKIRLALYPALQDLHDKMMYNRFGRIIYEAIRSNTTLGKGNRNLATGNLALLKGFEFNLASPFKKFCTAAITAMQQDDGTVEVALPTIDPAKDVVWPGHATQAQLRLLAVAFHPADMTVLRAITA